MVVQGGDAAAARAARPSHPLGDACAPSPRASLRLPRARACSLLAAAWFSHLFASSSPSPLGQRPDRAV